MTIAVTGSTGALGSAVARLVSEAGHPLRLLARNPAKAPGLSGAEAVAFDYDAPSAGALEGVSALFMVSAPESDHRLAQHEAVVSAARTAGVGHLVYTSFERARPDAVFTLAREHAATEAMIRESRVPFTLLRDNFYIDFLPHLLGEDGAIRGPAGDGRVAAVARTDVAAVASTVLATPSGFVDNTLRLTGPEALSLDEVAETITRVTGRPARFENESVEDAYASRASFGAPDWQLDAWVSTYTAIAAGELAEVTGDVARVIGRPPQSLAEFLAG